MSMREVLVWAAWRRKHGPMNDARRHDRPAALLAMVLDRVNGGHARMEDFMPAWESPEDEEPAKLEDIIAAFGGVNIAKRG